MVDFVGSVWWLIVALGVLVSFHEFGHFWVARRCGVRVLRFSVGFGSALWGRRGKDGTEYVVAAIPLGGYVKMLDEREGPVPNEQLDQAFNRKSLGQRTAIVAAGPIFNLVLALAAFWLMFMVGVLEIRAVSGPSEGLVAEAGIQPLDEIVAVDGTPTRTLTHVSIALLGHALDRRAVSVTIEDAAGRQRTEQLRLDRLPDDFNEENLLPAIGFSLFRGGSAVVEELSPGMPAEAAGILPDDRIESVNGRPVDAENPLSRLIQEEAGSGPVDFQVLRDDIRLTLTVRPRLDGEGEEQRYIIGVLLRSPYAVFQHGPLESVPLAFGESYRITSATLGLISRMVTGKASLSNLSGPITIAQFARDSARLGLSRFLSFLGILSLSLAILNFLPIPLLDGGHLMYYLIEWVKGSPVSEQAQIVGQYIGLTALAALMSLTFYNDILRLLS